MVIGVITDSGAEEVFHAVGRLALQAREHVAVGIERQRDLQVPEHLHDDTCWNPLCEQERRARVSEIAEALPPEPRVRQDALKPVRDVGRVERAARARREHQTPVVPLRA